MTIGTPDGGGAGRPRTRCSRSAMNGEPLPLEHGFPVRMVVPGLYGYVSATKWVVDLELTTFAAVRGVLGAAAAGPSGRRSRRRPGSTCRSRSRTVPAGRVAVAGVAWAQHRGIERVEVRVDDGAVAAGRAGRRGHRRHLAAVGRWSGTPRPASHTLTVRATDAKRHRRRPTERAAPVPERLDRLALGGRHRRLSRRTEPYGPLRRIPYDAGDRRTTSGGQGSSCAIRPLATVAALAAVACSTLVGLRRRRRHHGATRSGSAADAVELGRHADRG